MSASTVNVLELMNRKKEAIAQSQGRRKATVKPGDGQSKWRILPSWRGAGQPFWHDFGNHFIKGPDGKTKAVYVCVDKTYGRPCQICAQINQASAMVDKGTQELLRQARSSSRILLNAIPVGKDKNMDEPVILELSPTCFDAIVDATNVMNAALQEEGKGVVDITSIEEGFDVIITRTGTGFDTKYSANLFPRVRPLPNGPTLMGALNDLDKYVAQEYEGGMNKALASLSAVSGLLPAPAPTASSAMDDLDDLGDVPWEVSATPAATPTATPAAAAASEPETPAKSVTAAPPTTDELDDLLADLS